MMMPVQHLTITHSRREEPLMVDLPWDLFPAGAQDELDRLDADDSGTLVYSPETSPGHLSELTHADGSAASFRRLFWAFADEPYFTEPENERTASSRRRAVGQIQDTVYETVVLPLMTDPEDENQWRESGRILETLSDSPHLYEMARQAWSYWNARQDPKFLRIAERFLLEAERIESAFPASTSDRFRQIGLLLAHVDHALDRVDDEQLEGWGREPYLMAAMEAPVTVALREGQSDYEVAIRVAVPRGLSDEEVAAYFQNHSLTARPSVFQGYQPSDQDVPLSFVRLVSEQEAESQGRDFSSQMNPTNVNQELFGGTRRYVHAIFSLARCDQLLGDRDVRKFDLIFNSAQRAREGEAPAALPTGGGDASPYEGRVMPGSLALQELEGETIRVLFAADAHIAERDYDTARLMIQSLRDNPGEGISRELAEQYIDRIDRFYTSFNENLEAFVEIANQCYRNGECHRVALAGDLVDFVNVAATLDEQGYRLTNFRRLFHTLSKLEAPLSMKPGNHDPHIAPHARSEHPQAFPDDPDLHDLYADHYDRHIFGSNNPLELKIRSTEGLLTRRCEIDNEYGGHLDCIVEAMREIVAEDPYSGSLEEGFGPYFRVFGTNEADLTYMGNNFFLFNWKTNQEHFNQQRWVFEELHEPVGLNLLRGAGIYFNEQHVNYIGPRPDTALYFVRSVAAVRRLGGNMAVAEHVPPFYMGTSAADQTPDAADALNGGPNWLLRLAAYYYRHDDGSPVIDVVVSGHVHKWCEYDFRFDDFAEEEQFRRDLAGVFTRAEEGRLSGEELYEQIHDVWHRYHLDARIITRRVIGTGPTDPGPIVSEFNRDSLAYGRERGTLFVNLPATGPGQSGNPRESRASSPTGYMMMTVRPDGEMNIMPHFFYREPDGTLLVGSGMDLPQLRRAHAEGVITWQRSLGIEVPAPVVPDGAPELSISGPRPIEHWNVDLFPLLCQYPRGKVCFGVGVAPTWGVTPNRFGVSLTPLQLTIPLSDHYSGLWGGPNYLRLAVDYSTLSSDDDIRLNDWRLRAGVGLGFVDPYLFSEFNFGGGDAQRYGLMLQIGGQSAMVIPAIEPWVAITERGNFGGAGVGFRWTWEWLSVQP